YIIKVAFYPGTGIRHDNNHRSRPSLGNGFIGNVLHLSELHPPRMIVTTAMQQVQNRIAAITRVITGGQLNRVVALHLKNLTRYRTRFENLSMLSEGNGGSVDERNRHKY